LVAVPATVNVFSTVAILCCLSKFKIKFVAYLLFTAYMLDFLAYTYIIADLSLLVNHNISFWLNQITCFDPTLR
jgi:hypothetical protein